MQKLPNFRSCNTQGDLTREQRFARATAALLMLGYPMLTTMTPLGVIALLPLIAIYPMFTAVVGWDPVRYVLNASDETLGVSRSVARAGLVVIGTGLIGATMLTTVNPIGGIAVLALLGILPIFAAIFGENPLTALLTSSRTSTVEQKKSDQKPVSDKRRVVEYTPKAASKSVKHEHLPEHHEAA